MGNLQEGPGDFKGQWLPQATHPHPWPPAQGHVPPPCMSHKALPLGPLGLAHLANTHMGSRGSVSTFDHCRMRGTVGRNQESPTSSSPRVGRGWVLLDEDSQRRSVEGAPKPIAMPPPHPFDLFPLNLHPPPPPPPKVASAAPNPGRLGPGGQPPGLRAGLCLSRWGPSPPRASWNPRTEAPMVRACGSFPPTGDSYMLSWSCQSREDEGGAGGERQGPEAQVRVKARTSGTWALETMGGAGATGRGAAAPAPTLPAPCGCRAPLKKRGPLSENGVLRPG